MALLEKVMARLAASPVGRQANQFWTHLTPRDRQALKLLAIVMVALLLWLLVWQPAQEYRQASRRQMESQAELLQWMKAREPQARALQGGQRQASVSNMQGLNSLINRTARQHQLDLKRFEPEGRNSLRVWLERADFNRTMAWLVELERKHGLTISQIAVDRRLSGIADVKLVIKLG